MSTRPLRAKDHALYIWVHNHGGLFREEAVSLLHTHSFDTVLLDINRPGISGIETCKRMRRLSPDIPILMLMAHDGEGDTVEALEAGADDYVTKPSGLRELTARIRAAIRWTKSPAL